MIIVRDVFTLKFGKAKEARALMQESRKMMAEQSENSRVLFDLVGPSYTMVLENSYDSLSHFEKSLSEIFAKPEWREWYQKFTPVVERSYREIFSVMQ